MYHKRNDNHLTELLLQLIDIMDENPISFYLLVNIHRHGTNKQLIHSSKNQENDNSNQSEINDVNEVDKYLKWCIFIDEILCRIDNSLSHQDDQIDKHNNQEKNWKKDKISYSS